MHRNVMRIPVSQETIDLGEDRFVETEGTIACGSSRFGARMGDSHASPGVKLRLGRELGCRGCQSEERNKISTLDRSSVSLASQTFGSTAYTFVEALHNRYHLHNPLA